MAEQARCLCQHRPHLDRQVTRQVLRHGCQRVQSGLQGLRLPAAACRQAEGTCWGGLGQMIAASGGAPKAETADEGHTWEEQAQ